LGSGHLNRVFLELGLSGVSFEEVLLRVLLVKLGSYQSFYLVRCSLVACWLLRCFSWGVLPKEMTLD